MIVVAPPIDLEVIEVEELYIGAKYKSVNSKGVVVILFDEDIIVPLLLVNLTMNSLKDIL